MVGRRSSACADFRLPSQPKNTVATENKNLVVVRHQVNIFLYGKKLLEKIYILQNILLSHEEPMNDGSLTDLLVGTINLNWLKAKSRFAELDELSRFDALTPFYRHRIGLLPAQERKILQTVGIEDKPLRIVDIARLSRMWQQNHTSSVVSRLVKKGWLKRVSRGTYCINDEDPELPNYCTARWSPTFSLAWTGYLIPDHQNQITYFRQHKEEIERTLSAN